MGSTQALTRAIVVVGGLLIASLIATIAIWATRDSSSDDSGSRGAGKPFQPVSLESAKSDSTTISADELFPADSFTSRGRTYQVLATDTPDECADAGAGSELAPALETHDCRSVVRGTAIDATGVWVVTLGVADLADEAGATAVDDILNTPAEGRFTIMSTDTAKDLDDGRHFIKVRHETEGHYVLFLAITKLQGGEIENTDPTLLRIFDDCTAHLLESLRVHSLTGGKD